MNAIPCAPNVIHPNMVTFYVNAGFANKVKSSLVRSY